MASLAIPIIKLRDDAVVPSYAYPGDAGVDLRAVESVSLAPFERALVPTGLAIAIPEGYAGFVQPRSGLAIKQGVTVLNTPGLIDSHYRYIALKWPELCATRKTLAVFLKRYCSRGKR